MTESTNGHTPNDAMLHPPESHAHCMACGWRNPSSLGLHFAWEPDAPDDSDARAVRASLTPGPDFQGYAGLLHGGVLCTLLDAAMTHCLFHHGIQGLTGDLRVRFRRPVPCGTILTVRAWGTTHKAPLYHLKAELLCGDTIHTTALAKFMQRNLEDATAARPS